ncbi:uncharacterized protein G2W53_029928 [Senna tora]|uniref:Uncharacterized protein n=1 Tax=Senna tora TaxID=362788 RepID=A0A834WG87_9FABA|nr:uncharacterized protein G2W53_029928 [Senna tora]
MISSRSFQRLQVTRTGCSTKLTRIKQPELEVLQTDQKARIQKKRTTDPKNSNRQKSLCEKQELKGRARESELRDENDEAEEESAYPEIAMDMGFVRVCVCVCKPCRSLGNGHPIQLKM